MEPHVATLVCVGNFLGVLYCFGGLESGIGFGVQHWEYDFERTWCFFAQFSFGCLQR